MKEFKTWGEMEKYIRAYNQKYDNHYSHQNKKLKAEIVFSNDDPDWKPYNLPEELRTYNIWNNDKFWYSECCGYSLYAVCAKNRDYMRIERSVYKWKADSYRVVEEE